MLFELYWRIKIKHRKSYWKFCLELKGGILKLNSNQFSCCFQIVMIYITNHSHFIFHLVYPIYSLWKHWAAKCQHFAYLPPPNCSSNNFNRVSFFSTNQKPWSHRKLPQYLKVGTQMSIEWTQKAQLMLFMFLNLFLLNLFTIVIC